LSGGRRRVCGGGREAAGCWAIRRRHADHGVPGIGVSLPKIYQIRSGPRRSLFGLPHEILRLTGSIRQKS
jgi:hypothetical protein